MQKKDSRYLFFLLILILGFFFLPNTSFAGVVTKPENNLGLVGYWIFNDDGSSTAIDYSGNGNTGTLTNMDTGSDYVSGYKENSLALDFDGSNDYINISDSNELDVTTGSMTISLWSKPSNCSVSGSMITKDRSGSGVKPNYVFYGGNSVQFGISDGSNWDSFIVSSGYTCSTSSWFHVVGVQDRDAGVVSLYINGVLDNTDDTPGDGYNSSGDLHIAHREDNSESMPGDQTEYHAGQLDDIRIYNRALSAGEVAYLYSRSATFKQPSNKNLVGYWSFEDATGTTATDFSGNGNTGTLTNMDANTDWVDGRVGTALDFDGSDDYVSIAENDDLKMGSGDFTLSVWVKSSAADDTRTVIWYGSLKRYLIRITNGAESDDVSNKALFEIDDNTTAKKIEGDVTVADGTWHHIAAVRDGNTMRLYVDGLTDGTADITGYGSLDQAGQPFRIGVNTATSNMDGQIDEVRIYNTALTATQIQNLYNSSKKTTLHAPQNNKLTDGLVGYWTFNGKDLTTTTADDVSGNGNHGTLTNGPVPAQGKVGQALEFDGVNDYMLINQANVLSGATDFTVNLWAQVTDWGENLIFIDLLSHPSPFAHQLMFGTYDNTNGRLKVFLPNDALYSFTTVMTNTDWAMYTLRRSGSTLYLYENGALVESISGNLTAIGNTPVTSGIYYGQVVGVSFDGSSYNFDGKMDEFRLYDRALTTTEIERLYNLGR